MAGKETKFTPEQMAIWSAALNGQDPILASIAAKSKAAAGNAVPGSLLLKKPAEEATRPALSVAELNKPLTGTLDIRGAKTAEGAVALAWSEAESGYKNFDKGTMDKIMALVNEVGGAIADKKAFPQLFVNLDQQIARSTGEEKQVAHHALRLLQRARHFYHAAEQGKTEAPAAMNAGELNAYLKMYKPEQMAKLAKLGWKSNLAEGPEASAVDSAVPSAPAGDDAEPSKEYKGKAYAATGTPRGVVREVQLLLQADGKNTGKGNSARFGAGQTDKAAMDGIPGPATDEAIKAFQKENGLDETGALDEATITKLREVAGPKLKAAQEKQAPAEDKAVGDDKTAQSDDRNGTNADDKHAALRKELGAALTGVVAKSAGAINMFDFAREKDSMASLLTDDALKTEIIKKLKTDLVNAGVKSELAQTIGKSISINQDGVLSSPYLQALEVALGLKNADSNLDVRVLALLENESASPIVARAFNNSTIKLG